MSRGFRHNLNQHKDGSSSGGPEAPENMPTSPNQRMYFQERAEDKEAQAGNIGLAWRVRSDCDESILQRSLAKIAQRHTALRTGFEGSGPDLHWHDANHGADVALVDSAGKDDVTLKKLLQQALQRPFNLAEDAPVRWSIVRHKGTVIALILQAHACALDNTSLKTLLMELGKIYAALSGNDEPELADMPQLGNAVVEKMNELEKNKTKLKKYWDEALFGELPVLNLQTDNPRPPALGYRRDVIRWITSAEDTAQLRKIAGKAKDAQATLLLSAFQVFLHRYTGQDDVLVARSMDLRKEGEEHLVGQLENLIPARGIFTSKALSFKDFLNENRLQLKKNWENGAYPFARLLSDREETDTSRMPICQARFDWVGPSEMINAKGGVELWETGPLSLERFPASPESGRFDLVFRVIHTNTEWICELDYNCALYKVHTIKRMVANLKTMLCSIMTHPEAPLSQIDILSREETHELLKVRNDTQFDYPKERCFYHLFEDHVRANPNKVAVVAGEQQVTYEQLNARANQLAHYLIERGVGNEDFVGVCMHRSVNMMVALLGILKAGGAYVPLDPAFPEDRLEYMVEDSELPVLLTEDNLAEKIKNHSAEVLHLDREWLKIATHEETNPAVPTNPQCRAYVIYTSGSTGKPKGVQISHRAFQNFIVTMAEKPGIAAHDIWLSVTTLSFDICGLELWGPLVSGATIVLAAKQVTIDGPALLDLMLSCGATIMQATPVSWRLMLGAGWQPGKTPLKMLCGGEPLPPELADQLVERGDLWNMYGPTETTVWSTIYQVPNGTLPISIGKPIANTDIYLIDSHFQLSPVGGAGELVIGGDGLARGYHNRPDLTALQFVPNPYSDIPGDRMYKTGDLARWLSDATLECFGRIDHQVKVRGFRIELGEIESAIIGHDSVKQVVVIVREDSPGDKMLVGYLKTVNNKKMDVSAIRTFIREFLPEYMVPSAFVEMQDFPLTPNGKIDKKSLPAPDWSKIDLGGEYVAPRTEQEEVLANIWSQVLKIPKISVKDSFYEYGGNSLHAVQLVNRVREAFRVELPQTQFYKDPTIEGMSHLIDAQRQTGDEALIPPPIHRLEIDGHPLPTSNQHSLWYIDQLQPGNAAYNVPTILRINGRLDSDSWQQSLAAVVARHDALRTCLVDIEDQVIQKIASVLEVQVEHQDFSSLPPQEADQKAVAHATSHGLTPFDLANPPLFRFTLYKLGEERFLFLANFHHTIFDGWSTGVFLHEMLAFYRHFTNNVPHGLHDLPIQYADYSHWLRSWQAQTRDREQTYWKETLDGVQTVLELPRDKPRPPEQTFNGALQYIDISEELAQNLRNLGRTEKATLFVTLQTAFCVFLHRYTGLKDFLVGSPMANRGHAETEDLIGYFVNTVVLRGNVDGDPTFRQLLARVREDFTEMMGHQDFPFDGVVELLKPDRDPSRNPLFQVMFILHNNPLPKMASDDFTLEIVNVDRGFAQFDLTLVLTDEGESLFGGFEYNTALFDAKTAQRMAANFTRLLESATADPDVLVGYLPMLCEAERQHLLEDLNNTKGDYPQSKSFHHLFEEQVARSPEAPAVMFEDREETLLNYRELDQKANKLAHYLRTRGVGLESFVGLCMYRSCDMVVGLLGILKAGGAYVPLDPGFPQDRLAYMLEDSGLNVLITEEALKDYLGEHDARVVKMDTDWHDIETQSEARPEVSFDASSRAYVIYTSGSTGKPKGVQIPHQAFTNFAVTMAKKPGLCSKDILLAVTTLSFDICGLELWVPLITGAKFVLAGKETSSDGQRLLALLLSSKATVMQATPISWRLMLGAGWQKGNPLKMMCGGEPLPPELAQSLCERGELWNMYGPTETTVWSTIHPIDHNELPIPIGAPIANTDIYIVDRHGPLVPFGAAGELLIGGDGLARGYHNRPDLTAQQFIPNPFSGVSGDRMYKTGDLARYMPNSLLECLGRIDFQVKIRGYRIELGEIESALVKHPKVKQNVVQVREDSPGNKMLVAYTISEDGNPVEVAEVKDFLRADLPEYMVPSIFMQMEAFPLTPNGKIDKKNLPAPEISREDLIGKYVAPRTPLEEMLCEIWASILKVERVGVTDNFFELGGHSLLASQIVSRVRGALQVEVSLARFLTEPNIEAMAQIIDEVSGTDEGRQLPNIVPITHDGPPVPSLSQERLWFIDQMLPDSAAYSLPFPYRVTGTLNREAFKRALQHIVDRHQSLRTHFEAVNGKAVQIISQRVGVHLDHIDLSNYPKKEREAECIRLTVIEGLRPFKLAQPPLFRFTLMHMDEQDHLFLLNMHHTISDGWSIGVFMSELITCYDAYCQDETPQLKELPIQFADFAVWQRNWLQGDILEKETTFWAKALEGAQTVLELPGDRPRPKIQTYNGAMVELSFDDAVVNNLREISRENSATLFMLLHAAFNLFLYRYTSHKDLLVGTPMANRNHGEIEDLIGMFVNTLVLRTLIDPKASFIELLAHVRGQILNTFAHQDLPFEHLIELLDVERDLSRNPVFQVMFVLHNNPMPKLQTRDFQMEGVQVERGMAHFDLTLELYEVDGSLSGIMEYNTNLFDRSTAARMAGNFKTLIGSIAKAPHHAIGELALITREERKLMLVDWNDNALDIPEYCPFMIFEQVVARQPDEPAIYFGDDVLTYSEVNRRANQLAHRLRTMGVGPDKLVGISQERTPNMTISMLGIQKSGGAYVPLDPKHPEERVQYIMDEARVSVIVTQTHLAEKLINQPGELVIIDETDGVLQGASDHNPEHQSGMENLSHVIYTSGSTGKPKGVAINHRPVTQLVTWAGDLFTDDERNCMLASTSMNFDLSVYENIATLALGGTIVLVENALYLPMDPHRHLVRTINTVPSAIKELLRQKSIPENVTTVNLAGEQLKESVVWDLYDLPHIERVYNLYGPSEDTTYSTWALMERDKDYMVKIGVPLNNTQAYILDENLQPTPIGVPGELLLAGIGLARGYLNRPDLTEERFLASPFHKEKATKSHGPIMYKTGDLVRWRPNGQLECLGRIDHQVKIRGFRIELGEIEAVMQKHDKIHEVVVMDRENQFGEKYLAGYVTLHEEGVLNEQAVRAHVGEHLPEYMVPAYVVILDGMPLNPNGKIDRKKLPEPVSSAPAADVAPAAPSSDLEHLIADVWKEVLGVDKVGANSQFFEIGGNSLNATRVRFRLEEVLEREVQITDIFQYPTVSALAQYLDPEGGQTTILARERRTTTESQDIAVIGVALKVPGADSVAQFWDNLCDGVEAITVFNDQELIANGVDPELIEDEFYVKRSFIIDEIDMFDAEFFTLNPREARITDPQHRWFLEKSWEALEVAGYNPETYQGRIGVFAGVSASCYLRQNLLPNSKLVESVGSYGISFATDKDYMATRVAFKFNLKGPAMAVQTACSTGLMTMHMACKSLIDGESDMALSGAACIWLPSRRGYLSVEGGTTSPQGQCRPFDHKARGMVDGSGICVALLKRVEDALADGDHILAVVKGSAANNDGNEKVGFTAPSIEGQAKAIADAQAMADVHPESITYVEAHGTGTALGDPIEITALTRAFSAKTDQTQFCAIGSLKANIGHLDTAAGAAGFIKTVLCLHHAKLPPLVNFEEPNPAIQFEKTPFFVNTNLTDWRPDGPKRAAVSAFGIGGTNIHVILEEAPKPKQTGPEKTAHLIPLSAKTPEALTTQKENLANYLENNPDQALADIAYTLQVGRKAFCHRSVLVAADRKEALHLLHEADKRKCAAGEVSGDEHPQIVFMFSGQGAQYIDMAKGLYQDETLFRDTVDKCCEILKPHLGLDLRQLMYPEHLDEPKRREATERLGQTSFTQPALFVIEYATAQLWLSWGVKPHAMIGHSIGEYVAATLSGVLNLNSALALVAARGRLMQAQPPGSMMAVSMGEEDVKPFLTEQVQVATINALNRCVVAGPDDAIDAFAEKLKAAGKRGSKLHTSHAFHSAMMDPALPPFLNELKAVPFGEPTIKYVSNVTGTWITPNQAKDPQYYADHLRNPVRFAEGLQTLFKGEPKIFIEVGPGKTLMTFTRQQAGKDAAHAAISSIRHPKDGDDDHTFIAASVGQLWTLGYAFDWQAYHQGSARRRIPLPTYPFQRTSFWIDPPATAAQPQSAAQKPVAQTKRAGAQSDEINKLLRSPNRRKENPTDWFYQPLWKQTPAAPLFEFHNMMRGQGIWLVFLDYCGLGDQLVERLQRAGQKVSTVRTGEWYAKRADGGYTLNPGRREDYSAMFADLMANGAIPKRIVHLWNVSAERKFQTRNNFARLCQERGFLSLIHLAQAYDSLGINDMLHVGVLSNNMQEVTDGDLTMPEKATLLGACKVIPREYPHIDIRSIDVVIPTNEKARSLLVEQLLGELAVTSSDTVIAYRGRRRWLQTFEPAPLSPVTAETDRLKKGGVYLITGGLGGIGKALSRHLAERLSARLILIGRTPLPDRRNWDQWLAGHSPDDPSSAKIRHMIELEKQGAEVLVFSADVADKSAMRHALTQGERAFGRINGVIHAAGVAPSGPIRNITREKCETVLSPKVTGTLVLDELLRDRDLDFMLLISSTSSILGHYGNADYCAGNTFLDAFAHYHNAQSSFNTISVNSDAWRDDGMAASDAQAGQADLMLSTDDGLEGLRRILAGDMYSQIVLSPRDLLAELDKVHAFEIEHLVEEDDDRRTVKPIGREPVPAPPPADPIQVSKPLPIKEPEPAMPESINPPLVQAGPSETEIRVKELWEESLGISDIGPKDDFTDLGGDSLLATMVASRLRRSFKVPISPNLFNEEPTIAGMARAIDKLLGKDAKVTRGDTTESGKKSRPDLSTPYSAPNSDSEKTLAELWTNALELNRVGLEDDFIQLGGHENLAESLAESVSASFNLAVSGAMIMEEGTIKALAERIDTIRWATDSLQADVGADDDEEFEL